MTIKINQNKKFPINNNNESINRKNSVSGNYSNNNGSPLITIFDKYTIDRKPLKITRHIEIT